MQNLEVRAAAESEVHLTETEGKMVVEALNQLTRAFLSAKKLLQPWAVPGKRSAFEAIQRFLSCKQDGQDLIMVRSDSPYLFLWLRLEVES